MEKIPSPEEGAKLIAEILHELNADGVFEEGETLSLWNSLSEHGKENTVVRR